MLILQHANIVPFKVASSTRYTSFLTFFFHFWKTSSNALSRSFVVLSWISCMLWKRHPLNVDLRLEKRKKSVGGLIWRIGYIRHNYSVMLLQVFEDKELQVTLRIVMMQHFMIWYLFDSSPIHSSSCAQHSLNILEFPGILPYFLSFYYKKKKRTSPWSLADSYLQFF